MCTQKRYIEKNRHYEAGGLGKFDAHMTYKKKRICEAVSHLSEEVFFFLNRWLNGVTARRQIFLKTTKNKKVCIAIFTHILMNLHSRKILVKFKLKKK